MRVLWVATKAPWPPVDGGRLLTHLTVEALAAAGHELVLAAPAGAGAGGAPSGATSRPPSCRAVLVPAPPLPWALALPRALGGAPLTIARHRLPLLRAAVEGLLAEGAFDLVVADQVQALHAAGPARRRRVPVAVRCQNVESDVWSALGAGRRGVAGALLRLEARRLAGWEGRAVRGADLAFALTARDARRLADLAGLAAPLPVVPPPFPARLPEGTARLPGDPALAIVGPSAWRPNAAGAAWFAREVWPSLRERFPAAVLHVFGTLPADGRVPLPGGVVAHEPPRESAEAFSPGATLVVPVRAASGVRMKILEAWARGQAVVATPEAAAGLGAVPGREYLEAADAAAFVAAVAALRGDPALRARTVAAGQALLAREFDPPRVAARLARLCEGLARG